MIKISEARLRVWIYQMLMGTLGKTKRKTLHDELDKKRFLEKLDPIELKIWSTMNLNKTHAKQREFLKTELELWEKRTAPQHRR